MNTRILLFILLAGLSTHLCAQPNAYLYVQHPQLFRSGSGTIEDAVVAMTPNGSFMKYDVTMTFSARNVTTFSPNDSVEVQYSYSLPPESVVNDLWLWVGNELSRGLILERATASATYEGIVKRRRDPAFLQKTYEDNYKLQIYPMAATGTRTVKFSYVTPLKRADGQWRADIPGYLFRSSFVPLQSVRVIYYAPSVSHIPSIINDTRIGFTPWTDSLTRVAAWKCDIPSSVFALSDPGIAVPVNDAADYVVTKFSAPTGGTYQVMLDPFAVLGVNTSRRFLIAIDYDSIKTTLTRSAYIEAVKSMLKSRCTGKDSFNVIFDSWQRSGEKWFAADSAGIASAFSKLGAETIPNGSNIPGLFMNAVEFLNSHGANASILLLAASDKLGTPQAADPVITWLRLKLPAGTDVHIVDVNNRNYMSMFINGRHYFANQYFYNIVKSMTGGSSRSLMYGTDPGTLLNDAMTALRGGLTSLDIQMNVEDGFTYSKYSYGIKQYQTVLTSQQVGQIGKYVGSGAMSMEVGGFYRGQPYQKKFAIPAASITPTDSTLRAVWVGRSIADIEWLYTNTPDAIKMMTDDCLRERIVCRYTALLALEPGDTLVIAKNETPIFVTNASTDGQIPGSYQVASAYPNPFNPSTTLRVRLPKGVRAQDATLRIYNMLGQVVKTFDAAGLTSDANREFRWDAVDDSGRRVSSGMYLFVVITPGARHTVKLMLLK
ncbi:MAG TPA: VIT domain-containing protein [Bacteroidota bacterium]|nr:VIT domain-containing protein [Bacteroidota bacterium]